MITVVTMGRSPQNSIVVSEHYCSVSNNHADISMTSKGTLVLNDHSRNGTLVNGNNVHGASVCINIDDDILLAGVYHLDWNTIIQFLPCVSDQTILSQESVRNNGRRITQMHNDLQAYSAQCIPPNSDNNYSDDHQDSEHCQKGNQKVFKDQETLYTLDVYKWNWGAFFLTWIWGLGHKCYWPLFIPGISVLSLMLLMFYPVLTIIWSFVSPMICLVIAIYLGVNGGRIAWGNNCVCNVEEMNTKEYSWAVAGWIVFALCILSLVISLVMYMAIIKSWVGALL